MLKPIDVLIYDIQDIGCRSYTFISSMGMAMEAAGEAGIEFYVLDRPNPLGANRIEGPPLDPNFRSFVGRWDIPYAYGLTPGELARMIRGQRWITQSPKLTIVPMKHYYRSMYWEDTGLMWVPTSPNIPTSETSLNYVVTGWLGELGVANIGIGYTLPFAVVTSPRFNDIEMAQALNARKLPGVWFRPCAIRPFAGSAKGETVRGVQIHYTDRDRVNLTNLSAILLEEIAKRIDTSLFAKASKDQISMFDKVCGGDRVRRHFLNGKSAADLIASWQPSLDAFEKIRPPYLLYANEPTPKSASPTITTKPAPDRTKP